MRHEKGLTQEQPDERARMNAGIVMWSAVYDESIGGCIGGSPLDVRMSGNTFRQPLGIYSVLDVASFQF